MKNNIKALRANRNWSQTDLADKLGVSKQTIVSIENGDSESRKSVYRYALAYIFNVKADDIKM